MKNPKYTLIAHSSVAAMFLGLTPACALEDDESIEDLERFAIVDSTSSADEQEREYEREHDRDAGTLDRELDPPSAREGELVETPSAAGDIQAPAGAEEYNMSLGAIGSLCGPGSSRSVNADFNGDGYADLAIGVPNEGVGDIVMAGAVNVLYGTSSHGLDEDDDEYWHQNNISGDQAEEGDHFGSALAAGDFNCDGYDDLAIGVPGEDVGTAPVIVNAGMVHVIYGSATGLVAGSATTWHQDTNGIRDSAEAEDQFGYTLATGDFDGVACDDLAVGVPLEDVLTPGDDAGLVNVIYSNLGTLDLGPAGDELLRQGFNSINGAAEFLDYYGAALVAGDFDNDGQDDLAIGVPGEDIGTSLDAGLVSVIYGVASSGLITSGVASDQTWNQNAMSVGTFNEALDYTGISLTVGDFNRDGVEDLAVGVPYENWNTTIDAGVVIVLNGGGGGLTSVNSQLLRQAAGVVSGVREAYDLFGLALAAGDFDGDGHDDLAVGVPGEDFSGIVDAGRVHAIYGGVAGFVSDQAWDQDTPGIDGLAEDHDAFGSSLTTGDYDGNFRADLSVGVPLEDVGSLIDAGWVNTIYGKATGLDEDDDQRWHQNVSGVDGVAEQGDMFGCSLR